MIWNTFVLNQEIILQRKTIVKNSLKWFVKSKVWKKDEYDWDIN